MDMDTRRWSWCHSFDKSYLASGLLQNENVRPTRTLAESLSDIGTESTPLNEIPSQMERQKYHQIQQSQNNRFEEMSSSVTMTSSSEKSQGLYRSKTPINGQPFGPSGLNGLNGHARSNGSYSY